MLKNYFKVALRNLLRRKSFSLINILGLALGIAACLIIYLYVSFENSYDAFNKNADNIYRLKNVRHYKSGTDSSAGCIATLGPVLKEQIPEVVDFTRLRKISAVVSANNNYFNEKNIYWADSTFFTMFSFPLINGNVSGALSQKYSAVITADIARKYFGSRNAMGETIQIGGTDFKVTGIAANTPPNSHNKFDVLISFNTQLNKNFCWNCNNNNTYISLKQGTKKADFEAKLPLIVQKLHDRQKDGFDRAYLLQPLLDIHLHSNLRFEHEKNGSAKTIYSLSIIAFIILLIAWINYINLSTARSIERAKEVGLRKVVGADIRTLIYQFLFESFLVNLIAALTALIIVQLTSPYWKELIGLPVSLSVWGNSNILIILFLCVFVSSLVAGMYPAFILTSYSPVLILRGSFKRSIKGIILRKGLVIFQFAASIILITTIIVFITQLSFMRDRNLGLDIRQKLVVNTPAIIPNGNDRNKSYDVFINELKKQGIVNEAVQSSIIPGIENGEVSGGIRTNLQTDEQGKQVYFAYVTENYLNFFNINLKAGRNYFDSEIQTVNQNNNESIGLVINECARRTFGFATPEKAIGASIIYDGNKIGNVIGVINDYHQQSLDKKIEPTIYRGVVRSNFFIFSINTSNIKNKIEAIKSNFELMFPGNPFEFNFLDEFFDRQYQADIRTTKILSLFTTLAIIISCLGLIGLSSLMIVNKTKEIGIRKVHGASVNSILFLLSSEFLKWILIANLIAVPISYYFLDKWLQNFAYRINIGWWMFIVSGGIALFTALLTVSIQTVKAAVANPVESLRYE